MQCTICLYINSIYKVNQSINFLLCIKWLDSSKFFELEPGLVSGMPMCIEKSSTRNKINISFSLLQ